MRRFAKTICLCLVMVTLVSLLSGCHGSRGLDPFVLPEAFDESRTYEITFWAKNDTNKTQTDIYNKAIADFEKLYPNIKVNLRLYTDYGRIYNDVITNIATQTTPNVCITYPDHIATYLTGANTVVPLDGLFADAGYGLGGSKLKYDGPTKDEIVPQFLKEGGLYITSGIIIDRKDEVLACLEGLGFKILKVHTKNNWVCIEATI